MNENIFMYIQCQTSHRENRLLLKYFSDPVAMLCFDFLVVKSILPFLTVWYTLNVCRVETDKGGQTGLLMVGACV